MEERIRLEVWFNNGLFRAFPHVVVDTIETGESMVTFEFWESGTHSVCLNLNNVNFMERSPEN